jgi:hypothetical protein
VSACKSCGAEVLWARTRKGRRMPLDAEPSPDGNIRLADGVAEVVGEDQRGGNEDLFLSHFVTCPQAAQHRSRA